MTTSMRKRWAPVRTSATSPRARKSRACCANSNCRWTNAAAAAPLTAPNGSVRSTSHWNSMTSSVPEIVPASPRGREQDQPAFRISVKCSGLGSGPIYQSLVLPGFYPRYEPAFDLKRPSLRALGGGVSGHLDAREIVRRTMIGRQSANIWSFRHGSVNYINNV